MQVGNKHGWNRSNGSGFFYLMNLLLLCATCQAADSCTYRKGIQPVGCQTDKPVLWEHGRVGRLQCSSGWMTKELAVTNLEILIDNKILQPNEITRRTEYTISYPLDKLPPSKFTYTCRAKLNDGSGEQLYKILRQFVVTIAEKSKEPRNIDCYARDGEKIQCTWEPDSNYTPTRFALGFEPAGLVISGSSTSNCSEYVEEDKPQPKICAWSGRINPAYRKLDEKYDVVLTAENALGVVRFTHKFELLASVIPSKPINLYAHNITSTSAPLYWTLPESLKNFPAGLHHRVSYQIPSEDNQHWHTIDITEDSHATDINFDLNGLKPSTEYKVRVFMKNALAVGEDMWSQFSEITFKTPEKPVDSKPRSDIGSFEIVGNSFERDVYIYWQTIPPYAKNGKNVPYKVVCVEQNGRICNLQPDEITATYAKFTGIGLNSVRFDITPANSKGSNNPVATVQVPGQLELPPKPVVHTKVALGKGIYELSWDPPSNQDITNFTIFWCENERDRPYQCSGHIDWVHVPGNTDIHNVTVPDPGKIYQFAIAANTRQASSGMVWFSGMTTFSNDVGKVKSVRINRVESNEVEVGASLDYCGRIGTIERVNVYYCLTSSPHVCDGAMMMKSFNVVPHPTYVQGVISGLEPETSYLFQVAIVSENKQGPLSEPLYFTTLEAVSYPTTETTTTTTTTTEDTPVPTAVPVDIIIQAVFNESFPRVESLIKKSIQEHDEILLRKLDGIDEMISKFNDFETQVSNLTLTVAAFQEKIDSLEEENCKLSTDLAKCTDQLLFYQNNNIGPS